MCEAVVDSELYDVGDVLFVEHSTVPVGLDPNECSNWDFHLQRFDGSLIREKSVLRKVGIVKAVVLLVINAYYV